MRLSELTGVALENLVEWGLGGRQPSYEEWKRVKDFAVSVGMSFPPPPDDEAHDEHPTGVRSVLPPADTDAIRALESFGARR